MATDRLVGLRRSLATWIASLPNRFAAGRASPDGSGRSGRLSFRVGWWMCYNRKAVKATWKQESTPAECGGTNARTAGTDAQAQDTSARGQGEASRFCPVCSQRLESRRCKLICNVCGYYMSCADYY
jgi:hypothetical protein